MQAFVRRDTTSWNVPAWSVAVQVWTYLIFAFSFRHFGRFLIPATVMLAIGCGCYVVVATYRHINVFHDGAFSRRLLSFSLGGVASRAPASKPQTQSDCRDDI